MPVSSTLMSSYVSRSFRAVRILRRFVSTIPTIPTIPTIRPSALEMPRGDLHAHSTIRCHPSLTYEHPFLSFLSYVADYPSTLHSSVTRKLSHYTQKCCRPATPKSFTSGFTYATTFLIKRRHTYYLSLSIFKK
jgi:hypothetical protein